MNLKKEKQEEGRKTSSPTGMFWRWKGKGKFSAKLSTSIVCASTYTTETQHVIRMYIYIIKIEKPT